MRRLTAVVLPGGTRETFGYDALGRRTSMANPEVSLSFVYDALNRIEQATNQTLGQTIQYAYDANGNRTGMSGPLGEVQYLHDAADRLVTQVDPATGTYRVGYDAAGRRTSLEYPNGVSTEYEYDGASRLQLLLTRNPQGDTLDGYRYTYDPVGNRTSMRSLRDDLLHEYTYDQVDRLKRWDRGPERFESYAYDQVGNRLELQDERGTVTYSYDQANRLLEELRVLTDGVTTTTTYTWDPNGNLLEEALSTGSVTTYTWNALNRLETLEGPTGTHSYGYDPNGIRVRETDNGETTTFLHAGEDILATYESGALDTYFAHGPGIDEPWARARPGATDNPLAYLHRDGLGSVTGISNQNAQLHGTTTYSAFGEVDDSTGLQTRYGYTSRELDPTGLMYYRARYYQPEVGRFISEDPFDGIPEMPVTQNPYLYALDQPVNHTDPSGRVVVIFGATLLLWFWVMLGTMAAYASWYAFNGYKSYDRAMSACVGAFVGFQLFLFGFGAAGILQFMLWFLRLSFILLGDAFTSLVGLFAAAYVAIDRALGKTLTILGFTVPLVLKIVQKGFSQLIKAIAGIFYGMESAAETSCLSLGYNRI